MEMIKSEFSYHLWKNRLETFKSWPFTENCACTPEKDYGRKDLYLDNGILCQNNQSGKYKLAEAGFVYCGSDKEPDLVKCFVCFKELDGWMPDDDPWQEHVSHSGKCPFIENNDPTAMTCADFIKIEKTRVVNHLTRYIQKRNSLWNEGVSSLEELMGNQGKLKL